MPVQTSGSVSAEVRALPTATAVSLSSVRNGGEGRGEEVLRHGETVRKSGAPLSPALSPFVPHGAKETDARRNAAVAARNSRRQRPKIPTTLAVRIPCSHSPAPNSPAKSGRTHEPLRSALHAGRRPHKCGALPSAPSRSAFLPISAVFHFAPLRSERFLKTPQRSEGTQSGKGRKHVPRIHCGGCQSLASSLAASRAPSAAAPPRVFIVPLRFITLVRGENLRLINHA